MPRFEAEVANYCQATTGVAVNSATSALHLACLALGVGPGDEVWTSPNSFVASANCALYCGAKIDFVDIDPLTLNLSIDQLEQKLASRKARGGRLPKVLIPVHFAGLSCDMREIGRLAAVYGFGVIEDASHAIGGRYLGEPVGTCRYSDITVFSFHPVKIITSGEGGMALTKKPHLAERMRMLRSHGITRQENEMTEPSHGAWYYQMQMLGFNYRMTDIHAALGLNQLHRLELFVNQRNKLAGLYKALLSGPGNEIQDVSWQTSLGRTEGDRSAYHLFVVRIPHIKHKSVFDQLRGAGLGVNLHYIPIHLQPFYQQLGFKAGDFPEAERYYQEAISLPLYPSLSEADVREVVRLLRGALISAPS